MQYKINLTEYKNRNYEKVMNSTEDNTKLQSGPFLMLISSHMN